MSERKIDGAPERIRTSDPQIRRLAIVIDSITKSEKTSKKLLQLNQALRIASANQRRPRRLAGTPAILKGLCHG